MFKFYSTWIDTLQWNQIDYNCQLQEETKLTFEWIPKMCPLQVTITRWMMTVELLNNNVTINQWNDQKVMKTLFLSTCNLKRKQ